MTDWSAGTFDGSTAAMRQDIAGLDPEQRFAWLAVARRHAASTGALQAELDRRATKQLQAWNERELSP